MFTKEVYMVQGGRRKTGSKIVFKNARVVSTITGANGYGMLIEVA